jgi:hypothetical protein
MGLLKKFLDFLSESSACFMSGDDDPLYYRRYAIHNYNELNKFVENDGKTAYELIKN